MAAGVPVRVLLISKPSPTREQPTTLGERGLLKFWLSFQVQELKLWPVLLLIYSSVSQKKLINFSIILLLSCSVESENFLEKKTHWNNLWFISRKKYCFVFLQEQKVKWSEFCLFYANNTAVVDGVIFFLNVKNCVSGFWQNVFVKLKGKKNIHLTLTLTLRKKLSNFISRKSLVVLRCRWYFLSFWFSIIMVFILNRNLVITCYKFLQEPWHDTRDHKQ